ncbi:MAG: toxin-antitoxin system YwqK family antitoxin [Cyclobacteriaceae bacterium]|nr:toxin-antitoxin system YwqK family antitoxin [Cyclobacteriaceae bacterium HetDA_MAG_MS6]
MNRFLALILVAFVACNQGTSDRKEAVDYHSNGNKFYQGHKVGNLEDGEWVFWYENGKMEEKGSFKEGKKVGEWQSWYEDGTIKKIATYDDDILDGPYEEYNSNGIKILEGIYANGLRIKEWNQWSESGDLLSITPFKSGAPHGETKQYHINGNLSGQGVYEEGKLKGDWLSWYPNGQKALQIKVDSGRQLFVNVWDTLGNFQVENGDGSFVYPLPYGEIKIKGEVKDMKPVGKWLYLDENNEIIFEDSLNYSLISSSASAGASF